jgi:hypothetical protein
VPLAALVVVALLALATPSPVFATEIVTWPWGDARTFRAPFDLRCPQDGGQMSRDCRHILEAVQSKPG